MNDNYNNDPKRRQEEHLRRIYNNWNNQEIEQPCLHDQCPDCIGTGVKRDGSMCVHWISCPCPRCTPRM
jgi:hypothetical protein